MRRSTKAILLAAGAAALLAVAAPAQAAPAAPRGSGGTADHNMSVKRSGAAAVPAATTLLSYGGGRGTYCVVG